MTKIGAVVARMHPSIGLRCRGGDSLSRLDSLGPRVRFVIVAVAAHVFYVRFIVVDASTYDVR